MCVCVCVCVCRVGGGGGSGGRFPEEMVANDSCLVVFFLFLRDCAGGPKRSCFWSGLGGHSPGRMAEIVPVGSFSSFLAGLCGKAVGGLVSNRCKCVYVCVVRCAVC